MSKLGIGFSILISLLILAVVFILGVSIGVAVQDPVNSVWDSLSGWIASLATLMIAILTMWLAKETWDLRKLQQKQIDSIREESIRPSVTVTFSSSNVDFQFLNISIENTGKGFARNINFRLKNENDDAEDVYEFVADRLSNLAMVEEGMQALSPQEKKTSFFLSFIDLSSKFGERGLDLKMSVQTTFNDVDDKQHEQISHINFNEYKGLTQVGVGDPGYNIFKQLEKIQKSISAVVSNNKMDVNVYTNEDRIEDKVAHQKQYEKSKNRVLTKELTINKER